MNTQAILPQNLHSPVTTDTWHGFTRYSFTVRGCPAWIVSPGNSCADGKPWSWCMEFPDAFTERCAALELLKAGFHHCHVKVGNTFGCPDAQKTFTEFYKILQNAGLAPKGTLIGISRGGLYAYRFAALNPGTVAVIYGDAPVCDFKSWPGGKGTGCGSPDEWLKLIDLYGFKTEEEALVYNGNPIDILPEIARQDIKIIHVVGDVDTTVPWLENTAIVEQRYRKLGGTIVVIHKQDCDHHPHGLENSAPVVSFIIENSR